MSNVRAITGVAWKGGGFSILADALDSQGNPIKQAALSSITRKVFDMSGSTPTVAVSTSVVSISGTVSDTYLTGKGWNVNTTGYNFRDDLPATVLAANDHKYEIDYEFVPVSGAAFRLGAEVDAKAMRF